MMRVNTKTRMVADLDNQEWIHQTYTVMEVQVYDPVNNDMEWEESEVLEILDEYREPMAADEYNDLTNVPY